MSTLINFSKIPTGTTSQAGGKFRAWLRRMNITTNEQLTKFKPSELLEFKNFGKETLAELVKYLTSEGLSLKPENQKQPETYKTFEVWFRQSYPDVYNCYKCEHEAYKKANGL